MQAYVGFRNKGATSIGLSILYSPDDARLRDFISYLEEINDDDDLPDLV